MSQSFQQLKNDLLALADSKKAEMNKRFFKTSAGSYSEHEQFLGVTIPELRKLAKNYSDLEFSDLKQFLISVFNEERLLALLILIEKYQDKRKIISQKVIYDFLIANIHAMNNWNLVDGAAPYIIGAYLFDKDKTILRKWAKDQNLWKRRIAIISTYYFIRQNNFEDTLTIAELLLNDPHDLIHKAVGWMLREVAKRNEGLIVDFLAKHHKSMPRTMLRYTIERFPEKKRQQYLKR